MGNGPSYAFLVGDDHPPVEIENISSIDGQIPSQLIASQKERDDAVECVRCGDQLRKLRLLLVKRLLVLTAGRIIRTEAGNADSFFIALDRWRSERRRRGIGHTRLALRGMIRCEKRGSDELVISKCCLLRDVRQLVR